MLFNILKLQCLFSIFFGLALSKSVKEVRRVCARYNSKESSISVHDEVGNPQLDSSDDEVKIETCPVGVNYCYTLWMDKKLPNNATTTLIIAQGCWEMVGCSDTCQDESRPHVSPVRKETRFCCCSSDLCNTNVSVSQSRPLTLHPLSPRSPTHHGWEMSVVAGSVLALAGVVVCVAVWLARHLSPKECKPRACLPHGLPSLGPAPPIPTHNRSYSMDHLKLDKVIGQGRYGTVWSGSVRGEEVAVKAYPTHYGQYFYNERDIYTLPFMEHPALLTYFGSDECVTKEGVASLVVVVSYCPLGTLQQHLRQYELDLITFSNMAVSVSAGLAHLHTEIRRHGKWKPCIAHRDVNTKNVLVKNDLTCCICDMGLATKITGSKYYTLDEERHAQTRSINDVGTLRYMAPEVLEGAVNLRDCESSLKQIDVYALGLVLWEMAIRTKDMYCSPSQVPPYTLPFQHEVGCEPSVENMQAAVCKNKLRVGWPSGWRSSGTARLVKDTVEDSTDQDGEARLTALCVHERLSSLRSTSTPAPLQEPSPPATLHLNQIEVSGGGGWRSEAASEETCETVVTLSPSEGGGATGLTVMGLSPTQHQRILHGGKGPRGGHNPCLERNLLASSESSEEVWVASGKEQGERQGERRPLVAPRSTPRHHPIPYLQNKPLFSQHTPSQEKRHIVPSIIRKPLTKILGKKESHSPPLIEPQEKMRRRPASLELERREPLKELSCRVKTPGDLPPSVRKKRARFSLYDDRVMCHQSSCPPARPFDSSF